MLTTQQPSFLMPLYRRMKKFQFRLEHKTGFAHKKAGKQSNSSLEMQLKNELNCKFNSHDDISMWFERENSISSTNHFSGEKKLNFPFPLPSASQKATRWASRRRRMAEKRFLHGVSRQIFQLYARLCVVFSRSGVQKWGNISFIFNAATTFMTQYPVCEAKIEWKLEKF